MVLYERSGDDIDRGLVGFWKLDDLKAIPSDGIIAHYKMNDNAANTDVIDSKSGNTGTAANNTDTMDVAGKINNALQFNGSTDEVAIPYQNIGTSISYSIWFKRRATGLGNTELFSFMKTLIRVSDSDIRYWPDNADSSTAISWTEDTNWHNLTITQSGTKCSIYLDNNILANEVTCPAVNTTDDENFIGNFQNSNRWDGDIDSVRIYGRKLSTSEVSTIYNSGTGTETTELFRETIVAIDRSKFNDGTITGATNTTGINGLNADAMFFDGIDDKVVITSSDINLRANSSVAFWFKSAVLSQSKDNQSIIRANDDAYGTLGGAGTTFSIKISNDVPTQFSSNTITYTLDWMHIVLVIGESTFDVYKDGELFQGGISWNGTLRTSTSLNFGFEGSGDRFFQGNIAKVRLYNRILTAGEASKLHRLKL